MKLVTTYLVVHASATASWTTRRRTAAASSRSVGDAIMVLGRSQCREGGAENNGYGKRKCCLAEHFLSPG